jgi:hypothetical protein
MSVIDLQINRLPHPSDSMPRAGLRQYIQPGATEVEVKFAMPPHLTTPQQQYEYLCSSLHDFFSRHISGYYPSYDNFTTADTETLKADIGGSWTSQPEEKPLKRLDREVGEVTRRAR